MRLVSHLSRQLINSLQEREQSQKWLVRNTNSFDVSVSQIHKDETVTRRDIVYARYPVTPHILDAEKACYTPSFTNEYANGYMYEQIHDTIA